MTFRFVCAKDRMAVDCCHVCVPQGDIDPNTLYHILRANPDMMAEVRIQLCQCIRGNQADCPGGLGSDANE
jgi:hypothetical protein